MGHLVEFLKATLFRGPVLGSPSPGTKSRTFNLNVAANEKKKQTIHSIMQNRVKIKPHEGLC